VFPVFSRDVTNQTPLGRNNSVIDDDDDDDDDDVIIPAQGEFGSDIPAGDGKLAILFLRCGWKYRASLAGIDSSLQLNSRCSGQVIRHALVDSIKVQRPNSWTKPDRSPNSCKLLTFL
jgi:hypothetical protein